MDGDSGKLLIASSHRDTGPLSLARCNVDGTQCTQASLSSTSNEINGPLKAVIDPVNHKLLVIRLRESMLQMVRCELDLTGCTVVDISASHGPDSSAGASPVVDAAHQKLLIASGLVGDALWLARCNLDGSGCESVYLSLGNHGMRATALLDSVRSRLLVTAATREGNGALISVGLR